MNNYIYIYIYILLYCGKEEIHSEVKSNYLSTEVVQSNKYKSRAVGVTSKVGLTTDQDLAEPLCLRNTSFIPPCPSKFSLVPNCLTFSIMNCTIDLVIASQFEIVL